MTDDLERRLRSIDFEGDTETARKLRTEARWTLDNQVKSLGDIDSKAIKMLRVNVLLVGLILTALSFAANARSVSVESFLNVYLGTGILSLILSSATAAVTYAASDLEVGVDPYDVANVLELDVMGPEFEVVASKSYALWIDYNDATNALNAPWITLTVLLVVIAIAYLSLGSYAAFNDGLPWSIEAVTNGMLLVFAWRTGIVGQTREALRVYVDDSADRWLARLSKRLFDESSKN